ncbi:MAG TPA: energy transducer TonB [Thermomonas sp.]|jgi:TonB family protein|nr:energy transducer TonB [Thermomonas sp.]
MGLAAVLGAGFPARAASPPRALSLDFQADVQVDGRPVNIAPDPGLSPALQALVRKQVAGWRYIPGTWQGKPVPGHVSQRIVVDVVPAASDGFSLRIKSVTSVPMVLDSKGAPSSRAMNPPSYPIEAQRQGVEETLVYAIRRDPQGKTSDVELLDSQAGNNWKKTFDAAARRAIGQWQLEPVEVDGQRIDCRLITPITFRLGVGRSLPPATMPDMRPYLPRVPDGCPLPPVLDTKVEGVSL